MSACASKGSKEDIGSLEHKLLVAEPPNLGVVNLTMVICKCSSCSDC